MVSYTFNPSTCKRKAIVSFWVQAWSTKWAPTQLALHTETLSKQTPLNEGLYSHRPLGAEILTQGLVCAKHRLPLSYILGILSIF